MSWSARARTMRPMFAAWHHARWILVKFSSLIWSWPGASSLRSISIFKNPFGLPGRCLGHKISGEQSFQEAFGSQIVRHDLLKHRFFQLAAAVKAALASPENAPV